MVTALVLLVLAGAPRAAPEPLPVISAPLGHIGDVVQPVPQGGLPEGEKPLPVTWADCQPQVIYLARMLGGTARAVEQFDQWLSQAPAAKKKLFGKRDALGDTIKLMRDSDRVPKKLCKPPKLKDGFKLALDRAPAKLCADTDEKRQQGDFWFFTGKKAAAVIHVLPGEKDACRPRISTVLFDSKGRARVRFHADYGGPLSAELLGDGCNAVDFTFAEVPQQFRATWKPCKR